MLKEIMDSIETRFKDFGAIRVNDSLLLYKDGHRVFEVSLKVPWGQQEGGEFHPFVLLVITKLGCEVTTTHRSIGRKTLPVAERTPAFDEFRFCDSHVEVLPAISASTPIMGTYYDIPVLDICIEKVLWEIENFSEVNHV